MQNALVGNDSPWLFGIENLTADGEGYVYWKGRQVEHYNRPFDAENIPRYLKIADSCRHIESLGLTPNTGTVVWRWDWLKDIDRIHPYFGLVAMGFYDITVKGGCLLISVHYPSGELEVLVQQGNVHIRRVSDWFMNESYHRRRANGWVSADIGQGENLGLIYGPLQGLTDLLSSYRVPSDIDVRIKSAAKVLLH